MRRWGVLAVIPLLLAVGVVGFSGGRASAITQSAQSGTTPSQTCILFIICFPSPSSPSPTPSPTSSAAASPSAVSPSASTSAPSGAASSPGHSPTAGQTGTPVASASAGATPSAGSPSPAATSSPSPTPAQPNDATAASGLVVSNVTWTMAIGSAALTGFTYKGNVNLPLSGGGTIQMMEFTVSSIGLSNAVTQITENGVTATETDASFSASGVTLYATELSGDLFGAIPVTFTPSTLTVANLLKLPNAGELQLTNLVTSAITTTMTNISADRTVILADQAQKLTVSVTD